ncbi:MAG: sulfite exporter TauE/SafE family protein [Deltaproteobacteria bacterium]
MIDTLTAAAAFGFVGSLHCAVMCGPLAAAGCTTKRDATQYALGRGVAYTFAGALLGAAGLVVHDVAPLHVLASWLAAAVVVWHGVQFLRRREGLLQLPRKDTFSQLFAVLPRRGLGLGLLTGLMPCGLLWAAWGLAAATARPLDGALVMFTFSVATLPALLVPAAFRGAIQRFAARVPAAAIGVVWCAVGVWLFVRPFVMVHEGGCH